MNGADIELTIEERRKIWNKFYGAKRGQDTRGFYGRLDTMYEAEIAAAKARKRMERNFTLRARDAEYEAWNKSKNLYGDGWRR